MLNIHFSERTSRKEIGNAHIVKMEKIITKSILILIARSFNVTVDIILCRKTVRVLKNYSKVDKL